MHKWFANWARDIGEQRGGRPLASPARRHAFSCANVGETSG
jgi:hypothetical protein